MSLIGGYNLAPIRVELLQTLQGGVNFISAHSIASVQ
jgi:hypothetical protein